ncbi:unnamed protein product [Polarella glacialis]|uniref:Uncharacterized protein n=1 Tax=Polarella glacialis TaxID=89957 RepID=A0A813GVB9_POLGL|nr:unnamed protein product [Polarella glacialis]
MSLSQRLPNIDSGPAVILPFALKRQLRAAPKEFVLTEVPPFVAAVARSTYLFPLFQDASSAPEVPTFDLVPPAQAETLIFFDWDDTLLPTSWLIRVGIVDPSCRIDSQSATLSLIQKVHLRDLVALNQRTLRAAMSCGRVVIVTNAEHLWVQQTCRKFMPDLLPIIRSLKVVSARMNFQCEPGRRGTPVEWKRQAFSKEINAFYSQELRRNVLSCGDAPHEHEALIAVTSGVPMCCGKSMRFSALPELADLVRQHTFLCGQIKKIAGQGTSLQVDVAACAQRRLLLTSPLLSDSK